MKLANYPSVSVVIPCHNNSAHLEIALSALARQTAPPDQLICVDDASTHREREQLKRVSCNYGATFVALPSDKLLRGRRSMARNWGSRRARGDVLLYLDADMIVG